MMEWTDARDKSLLLWWKEGLTTSQIAAKLGGFETYHDKGRAAVSGRVKRKRDEAKKNGNAEEAKFWSRGQGAAQQGLKSRRGHGTDRKRTGKMRTGCEKPIPRDEVAMKLASVVVPKIEWPTAEEATANWKRQLFETMGKDE